MGKTRSVMERLGYDKAQYLEMEDLLSLRWDRVIPIREIAEKVQRLDKKFPRSICYEAVRELFRKNGDYLHPSEMSWLCWLPRTSTGGLCNIV